MAKTKSTDKYTLSSKSEVLAVYKHNQLVRVDLTDNVRHLDRGLALGLVRIIGVPPGQEGMLRCRLSTVTVIAQLTWGAERGQRGTAWSPSSVRNS